MSMSVLCADALIPSRFLTLIAHLTITVVILSARDEVVTASLPYDYEEDDNYQSRKSFEILIGLSLAIGLLAIELTGFIFGLSMFMPAASVLSIGCHASAAIALSYALFDSWDSSLYWAVFALCSVPPGLVEMINAVNILVLKRV
ncbi:hypothetical protein LSTR_LSTR013228 [Laodelphax striatellus]|uniref:Transmembrane protein 107 n=1 Tax=Laodelphax striatellus TaxID=195883 RepID=A0A482X9H8_LAOST|nr:hypothetical protein LSTR_LSTR013228 [Laodelphax striatellus]